MYSLVMLAAMMAGPDVPKNFLCPVTPSNYGCGFWSKHDFFECCAPARYGSVTCWTKGFGVYPGNARSFGGGCCPTYGPFYRPSPCACAPCGAFGYGGGGGGCGFCGYGWGVGCQPAYYTSVLGCPPCVTGPPYANYTNCKPCCNLHFAFDTGLIGHSHGVGYSGFGGTGNFGFYGGVPMQHKPTTADLPPFPRPEYPYLNLAPSGPVPMPPLPGGTPKAGTSASPPDSLLPPPPPIFRDPPAAPLPPDVKKDEPRKKDEPKADAPKKGSTDAGRPARATVVLSVPARATVTVEGQALTSTGGERSFRSPEIAPGQEFVYTVRAVIEVSGREEVETRQVKVTAGETSRISFEKLFAKVDAAAARSVAGGK
jgi:uncharacterized protein (TIGR03000 family)